MLETIASIIVVVLVVIIFFGADIAAIIRDIYDALMEAIQDIKDELKG